jgi:hypothetical protein
MLGSAESAGLRLAELWVVPWFVWLDPIWACCPVGSLLWLPVLPTLGVNRSVDDPDGGTLGSVAAAVELPLLCVWLLAERLTPVVAALDVPVGLLEVLSDSGGTDLGSAWFGKSRTPGGLALAAELTVAAVELAVVSVGLVDD